MAAGEKLRKITSLPDWVQPAFEGMTQLNRIQSRVCECALFTANNMLICAPTGAGKTNVAVLSVMHEIGKHRLGDGSINKSAFKIVYIAPMKALVAEMVGNFTQRLSEAYGIQVGNACLFDVEKCTTYNGCFFTLSEGTRALEACNEPSVVQSNLCIVQTIRDIAAARWTDEIYQLQAKHSTNFNNDRAYDNVFLGCFDIRQACSFYMVRINRFRVDDLSDIHVICNR